MMGAENAELGFEEGVGEDVVAGSLLPARKMQAFDFEHIGSLAAVAESLSPGSKWRRALTSVCVVIFQVKINVLLPFGPLAVMLHYLPGKHAVDFEKFREKLKKFCKRPPDMPFGEEIDKIDEYDWSEMARCKTSILHVEAIALSMVVCGIAVDAIKLASKVMACAGLRRGMPGEISQHTIKQTVKMYVGIFLSTVDDTHQMKATMETIVSFLGALGGVAAISHILLQDALANLDDNEDSSSNYNPDCDVDRALIDRTRREFEQRMNNLKHKFRTAPRHHAYKILRPTLVDAIILTRSFVTMMVVNRESALGQVQGGDTRAPDDGEPEDSDTGSDSV